MTSADSDPDADLDVGADADADATATATVEEPAEAVAQEGARRASRWPVVALSVSIALVVAAAAVATWFGIAWFNASHDDGLAYSGKRDDVDRIARTAIVTMNTLDYRKLDEGLASWADTTTGALHTEITGLTPDKKKQLTDAKPVTSAKVTSSAVKELDDRGGKATVIAAIEKTVQTGNGKPQPSYQRIQATMTRTGDGWKLDNLGPVPYAQPQ
jgi:Mce-associated membrane protein